MKIAHLTPSFFPATVYGGPTESVYRLCLSTAARGAQVRVLTTNANGPREVLRVEADQELTLAPGLQVQYCSRFGRESISGRLLSHLQSYVQWADVVHLEAVYSFPTIPALWMAGHNHKPVVWSPRGALARWRGARRQGMKWLYDQVCRMVIPQSCRFHFTSAQEQEASLRRFPGCSGEIIPNGVDVVDLMKTPAPDDALRLLYLGRLDPIKGLENLLDAVGRLQKWPSLRWRLTLAGAGERFYVATLEQRIAQLGLGDRVSFVGQVDGEAKEKAFAACDVVIVPSHLENFCIVAAEALARAIPVIVSRGAPWGRLEMKGCGLWVSNDPDSLAHAIESMSRMPRTVMGKKGQEWMKEEFSWDGIARRMMVLYQELGGVP